MNLFFRHRSQFFLLQISPHLEIFHLQCKISRRSSSCASFQHVIVFVRIAFLYFRPLLLVCICLISDFFSASLFACCGSITCAKSERQLNFTNSNYRESNLNGISSRKTALRCARDQRHRVADRIRLKIDFEK